MGPISNNIMIFSVEDELSIYGISKLHGGAAKCKNIPLMSTSIGIPAVAPLLRRMMRNPN